MLIKRELEGKQGADLLGQAFSKNHDVLHLSRTNFIKWNGLCDCGEYVSVASVCGGRGREGGTEAERGRRVGMREKIKKLRKAYTYPSHTPM